METGEDADQISTNDHDYSTSLQPVFVDPILGENESLHEEIVQLRQQLEQLSLKQHFWLHRFTGSDRDIRFYTRHM